METRSNIKIHAYGNTATLPKAGASPEVGSSHPSGAGGSCSSKASGSHQSKASGSRSSEAGGSCLSKASGSHQSSYSSFGCRTSGSRPSFFYRRGAWFTAALLAVALVAAACSSDDEASTETSDTATSVEPAATATSASPVTAVTPTTVSPTTASPAVQPSDENGATTAASSDTAFAPGNLEYPDPLPDAPPGTIIDVEPLGEFGEVSAYRILYHSINRKDENIAVSGYVLVPLDDSTEEWPVVAYAHGTAGMADQCAPSATVESNLQNFGGEAGLLGQVASRGYVVVATDFEGLGTPGLHPYLVGESEARSILDSVRAVQQMEGLNVSNSFAVAGISQGGHAALHAGQYWQTYAPELDLVGVVSMAPPSQATLLYDAVINTDSRGFIYMALGAYDFAYDEIDASEVLTPRGLELLAELENGCTDYVFDVFNSHEVSDLISVDNPLAIPAWRDIAIDNDVNQRALPAPLFIVHGGADTLIPAVSSSLLCAQITPIPDQGPTLRRVYEGASHGGVALVAANDIITWLTARFAGEAVEETGCG